MALKRSGKKITWSQHSLGLLYLDHGFVCFFLTVELSKQALWQKFVSWLLFWLSAMGEVFLIKSIGAIQELNYSWAYHRQVVWYIVDTLFGEVLPCRVCCILCFVVLKYRKTVQKKKRRWIHLSEWLYLGQTYYWHSRSISKACPSIQQAQIEWKKDCRNRLAVLFYIKVLSGERG